MVLICVDQWRGDALGCAGHPVVQTPYLDQLAGEGVRFSNAYCATPSCIPARAALYTGLSQTSTGRVGYADGVPFDYPVTIASEFTNAGYQTQAIGKLHVWPERSQIGFQNVILHDGYLHFARKRPVDIAEIDDYVMWLREKTGNPHADLLDNGLNCNAMTARPWHLAEELHPSTWVIAQGQDFLRRRDKRKPFFLYLGLHRPHPPYDPPEWAFNMYQHEHMPDPPVGDWTGEVLLPYENRTRADASILRPNGPALQRARAGYYGHMTHIDGLVNRFLETLQEYGQRKNTVVCFVSDHGEMMGDHHAFRKTLPYEGSARIPLLLSGPGIPAGVETDAGPVELRDVMPTLLDAAKLKPPATIDGESALSLLRRGNGSWRAWLHGEHPAFGQSVQWLTDGAWKYIWWSGTGREQLFHLQNDPNELNDLRGHTDIPLWRSRMVNELIGREEGFVSNGQLVTGKPVTAILRGH